MVLTKFLRNEAKSRPYWLRGGICEGPAPGKAPQGTDRAPQGWVQEPSRRRPRTPLGRPAPRTHPLQPVGLPGPASLVLVTSPSSPLGGYYPPPTHPAPVLPVHAVLHAASSAVLTAVLGHP